MTALNSVPFLTGLRIFHPLWAVTRPLLSEWLHDRVHILGSNYAPTLLQYIDAAALPAMYGACLSCSSLEMGDAHTGGTCACSPHCIPPKMAEGIPPVPKKPM